MAGAELQVLTKHRLSRLGYPDGQDCPNPPQHGPLRLIWVGIVPSNQKFNSLMLQRVGRDVADFYKYTLLHTICSRFLASWSSLRLSLLRCHPQQFIQKLLPLAYWRHDACFGRCWPTSAPSRATEPCSFLRTVWAKLDAQTTQATQPNLTPNEIPVPVLSKVKNWICQIVAPMKDIMSANTRDECAMTQINLLPIQSKIPILHPTWSSLALWLWKFF